MNWKCEMGMIETQYKLGNNVDKMQAWAREEQLYNCEHEARKGNLLIKIKEEGRLRHQLADVLRDLANCLDPAFAR